MVGRLPSDETDFPVAALQHVVNSILHAGIVVDVYGEDVLGKAMAYDGWYLFGAKNLSAFLLYIATVQDDSGRFFFAKRQSGAFGDDSFKLKVDQTDIIVLM